MRLAIVAGLLVVAGTARAGDALTIGHAIELALERSVDLAAAEAQVRAARARFEGARLPFQANPDLDVGAGPRVADGERTTDVELAISQRVELFGQRSARIETSRGDLGAAEAARDAKRAEVAAVARVAFARVLAADQLAAIAEEDAALSRDTAAAAAKRVEFGSGSRLEIHAARVEVGRGAAEAARARQAVEAARSALRLLLGLHAEDTLRLAGDLSRPRGVVPTPAEVVRRATETRADIVAARRELDAATAEARLATLEILPSPRVGFAYAREERADVVRGVLSLEVPVWNRNIAGRGVAAARVTRAQREIDAVERRVRGEALLALARLQNAQRTAEAFDTEVIGAAQESFALTRQAYDAGKLGIVELLLIRRSALEARRGQVEALEQLFEAEAELQRAIGSV